MADDQVDTAWTLEMLEARRKSCVKVLEALDQIPRRRTVSELMELFAVISVQGWDVMADDQVDTAKTLAMLEERRKSCVKVLEALDQIPRRRTVSALVPLGPGAIVPGKIKHTNEVMVLLGGDYFVNVSAYDTSEIVKRRIARIDERIITLTSTDAVTGAVGPSLASEKTAPQAQVVIAEKKSVSFSSDTKTETAAPRALPLGLPSNPAEKSKLLENFAEALASGRTALQNELNENVVLLEEEYADQESMNPVKVHGINQDHVVQDYVSETESEEEETQMRSVEEEMALLAKLVAEEEESSKQQTKESTIAGLRKGFLLESKRKRKPPVTSSKASQPVQRAETSQSLVEVRKPETISDALTTQYVPQDPPPTEAPKSSKEKLQESRFSSNVWKKQGEDKRPVEDRSRSPSD
eukprot:CAMPEP_0184753296 /NCGR_PEP_ID=MMETSP0315-20130426/44028_1 /TAXON_ID=101924 /ORGANISM="Rhodosorus marinus, Strain UTEX LB 2760" /LENGTH=410 /DNA_ID=CAMNT_0027232667 /DNA_START=204 /DNA_END=1438 /DNA_ORIENTATION=-